VFGGSHLLVEVGTERDGVGLQSDSTRRHCPLDGELVLALQQGKLTR
jgi:hypothetical protein